ncbi:MAG: 30S ribosomal protein S20 [candidate division CPR1 bacterium GW2011_GWC1_49_13]|uniref:Small ribosomal subunit protein bS20 n=1 Tax=candidate division CPR1 bacterium GW2011_GWC1_49_13 TaxID=1618342 RepID=A0A0G1VIJ7_9BACT|nr:MAG: 30S ribosomal protein S20 [candidate division CPR1 bacterium GW2011_GWC1_49_13]
MPHLKSAYKNLRKSRKIAQVNREVKESLKKLLKKPVTAASLPALYKAIDKAAKRRIFSANKAARLKSSLAKKIGKTKPATKAAK